MTSPWRAALARAEGGADERMMAIVPRGFDEHAPQMGVAGFGDPACGRLRPAGMLRRDQADERHRARRRGKAARVAEFGGDRQAVRSSMPRKQRSRWTTRARSGSSVEQRAQVLFDGARAARRLHRRRADRPDASESSAGQRPRLRAQPGVVPLRPRLLRGREAPAMAEEEFREPMPRAEQIGADIFAAAQQIAGGFFLLGGNVDRRSARRRGTARRAGRRRGDRS